MSVIVWECPATPERPCMCDCHRWEKDYGGEIGVRLSMGCSECSEGTRLATPKDGVKE